MNRDVLYISIHCSDLLKSRTCIININVHDIGVYMSVDGGSEAGNFTTLPYREPGKTLHSRPFNYFLLCSIVFLDVSSTMRMIIQLPTTTTGAKTNR